jgi:hypothetical protein
MWRNRLRALVVTGLSWGVVWGIAGAVLSPGLRILANAPDRAIENVVIFGMVSRWYGFLAGSIFGLVVMIAGRRRRFDELGVRDPGRWGVSASLLFILPPMGYTMWSRGADWWRSADLAYLSGGILLSVGCAIGTLLIARRMSAEIGRPDSKLALATPDAAGAIDAETLLADQLPAVAEPVLNNACSQTG